MRHVRHTVQRYFEWDRYLLFDLLRRDSRPLCNDFDVIVRNVRIGFYRKHVKREDTRREKQQRKRDYKETMCQCKIDNATDHG
jgi:hypothetical protein